MYCCEEKAYKWMITSKPCLPTQRRGHSLGEGCSGRGSVMGILHKLGNWRYYLFAKAMEHVFLKWLLAWQMMISA